MYTDKTIKEYLDDLAARRPTPGGGSAAALEGATGCGLMSMVANYTISNKRYAEFKEKAAQGLVKSERMREELLRLIDEDVEAYRRLSDGLKSMDKNPPKLLSLYKKACTVPLDICKITAEALALCGELAEFGNKGLITDTAISALMLESAFLGGKLNILINLKYIKDSKYTNETRKVISGLEKGLSKLKKDIIRKCEESVS